MNWGGSPRVGERRKAYAEMSRVNFSKLYTQNGPSILASASLVLMKNAYTSCARLTLKFVERFWCWLESVHSAENNREKKLT